MRTASVAVPLLLFTAFLLTAAGHGIMAIVPFVSAFVVFLAFPYYISEGFGQQPESADSDTGWLRMVRRATKFAILMWFISQPEVESFEKRIMDGSALWDWRLITPVAILAIYMVISGLRRASLVIDTAIYKYFTSTEEGGATSSRPA